MVLDSVGIGELPDASKYGDVGSNTLGNILKKQKNLDLVNLNKLGLNKIEGFCQESKEKAIGAYARLKELSNGKDTITGHWEMAGIYSEIPFPTYPNGFPTEIISEFENKTKRKVLGNKASSGTVILDELGEEHMKTGGLIVYTSADSVFQIAAHENIVSVEKLYEYCEIARKILKDDHQVARVIARPFIGEVGNFIRTAKRKDYAIKPTEKTFLTNLKEKGYFVKAVGKIEDIFCNQGITNSVHTNDNMDGLDKTLNYMKEDFEGVIFTNLVDFDMKWGHRNDVVGYANGLKEFDNRLNEIIENLKSEDILIITADHGCDPTFKGTDHTREYVPMLVYGEKIKENINLKTRDSFSDIGQTICEYFNVESLKIGKSFLNEVLK